MEGNGAKAPHKPLDVGQRPAQRLETNAGISSFRSKFLLSLGLASGLLGFSTKYASAESPELPLSFVDSHSVSAETIPFNSENIRTINYSGGFYEEFLPPQPRLGIDGRIIPSSQAQIDFQKRKNENPQTAIDAINEKMAEYDPSKVELMQVDPEIQRIFDDINTLTGGVTKIGMPVRPSDVPDWYWYKGINYPLKLDKAQIIKKAFEDLAPDLSKSEYTGKNNWADYLFIVINPDLGTGGGNTGLRVSGEDKIQLTILLQDVRIDHAIENPYFDKFSHLIENLIKHESHHTKQRRDLPRFALFQKIDGWVKDPQSPTGFSHVGGRKDLKTISGDRINPFEAMADAESLVGVNPEIYSDPKYDYPEYVRYYLAVVKANMPHLWALPKNRELRDYLLSNPPAIETNTPTPSPTDTATPPATNTPKPTNTPRPSSTPTETEEPYSTSTPLPSKTTTPEKTPTSTACFIVCRPTATPRASSTEGPSYPHRLDFVIVLPNLGKQSRLGVGEMGQNMNPMQIEELAKMILPEGMFIQAIIFPDFANHDPLSVTNENSRLKGVAELGNTVLPRGSIIKNPNGINIQMG